MTVAIIPSFYPTQSKPYEGIFFVDQARAAHAAGAQVALYYLEKRSIKEVNWKSVICQRFQKQHDSGAYSVTRWRGWNLLCQTRFGSAVWVWLSAQLIEREMRTHGLPDILHAQNCLVAGVLTRILSKRIKRPYVITEHHSAFMNNTMRAWHAQAARGALRDAHEIIAVSRALAAAMGPYAPRSAIVIPNAVDVEFFGSTRPRKGSGYQFVCVGRLDPNKNFQLAIRAFAANFRNVSGVRLTIAGEGSCRKDLANLIRELAVEDQVALVGPVDREKLRNLLWGASALVLTSRQETFGVVLIEALAAGVPVIATRCGGPEDIVNYRNGILIGSERLDELQAAMLAIMQRRYSEASLREEVRARFGYCAVASSLAKVYENTIQLYGVETKCKRFTR